MAISKEMAADVMERTAVNPSGSLGSPYDGFRDHVIEQDSMNVQRQWPSLSKSPKCELIRGDNDECNNLLHWIGIQDGLRLSLLLKSIKTSGIAKVLMHPYPINQHTRFLYYSWISEKEELIEKEAQAQKIIENWKHQINATHMITSITVGIDVVVVLQLPSEADVITGIDRILETIRDMLRKNNSLSKMISDKDELLGRILNTTVYSNTPALTSLTTIADVLNNLDIIKMNFNRHYPLSYTLQLITTLYPSDKKKAIKLSNPLLLRKAEIFKPLSFTLTVNIEQYILQVRNPIHYADASLNTNVPQLLCGHLAHLLKRNHTQWSKIKAEYMSEIQLFAKLVVDARSGGTKAVEKLDQELQHGKKTRTLKNSVDELIRHVNDLEIKGNLITDLRQQRFEYWNAGEWNLNKSDDMRNIGRMLISNDRRNRILCSSDALNKNNHPKLTNLRKKLVEKHKDNLELHLIYMDFSYSSFPLHDMVILPLDETDHIKNYTKQKTTSPTNVSLSPPKLSSSPTLKFSKDEVINILLLGETGVGKSTFINAFANYLTFNSLEQAQSNEPIVLIPVSFIMTVGDDFEEQTIKFGECDSSNNEDFNTVGQSVTQHCKSYVFNLNENGQKLRIIDTPGFGDTRGLDQDDRNMEHILQYISNLTHLNAICFLLKPNSSRLNMFFRTCLTQLFSFLASTARKNVIFCFTNGRSTFYTPGDTAPLLKAMLKSLSISDISFEKENTFCFDSESFRYLVAIQNDVSFNKEDKQEYQTSWSTSVKESNRLVHHINKNLRPYRKGSGWQSIKAAQFEISYMVRPMLETMRNILRNLTFRKNNLSNQFIELSAKAVHHTATRCLSCKPEPHQIEEFWVLPTVLHEIQDKCRLCTCPVDQHVRIDYMLEYQCLYDSPDHHKEATNNILEILCSASAEFAHFLMLTAHSLKFDPFLIGLKEMIHEENQICQSQKFSHLNFYLVKKLTKVQELYEFCIQKITERKSNQGSIDLPAIYRSIDNIAKYPMVHEQMAAVKQSQQMMMEDYECEVQAI